MSAQLMRSAPAAFENARPLEASAEEANAAWRNYYGYWGTFTIDPKARIIVHHIEGSWFPNWIGQKQIRSFRFSGNKLILEADSPAGHSTLTWQRID
jgi:hypothetical protein